MAPYRSPIRKCLPPGKENDDGAMKSFAERPDSTSHFHSKKNRSLSPIWNMSCISFRRSLPFSTFVTTPNLRKLFRISVWIWISLGFACFMDSASMPKVRYLVLVRPLLPWASCVRNILLYSSRTSLNPSFFSGIRMLFSKSAASVLRFINDSSKFTELSKKFRKPHHSSKMAVLSSCWAS